MLIHYLFYSFSSVCFFYFGSLREKHFTSFRPCTSGSLWKIWSFWWYVILIGTNFNYIFFFIQFIWSNMNICTMWAHSGYFVFLVHGPRNGSSSMRHRTGHEYESSSMISSDLETTSFVDSEEDASSRITMTTGNLIFSFVTIH